MSTTPQIVKITKDDQGNKVVTPVTQAEVDEARAKCKRLIDKARAFIVLDHPFFASIMLKRPFTERFDIPTLAVTDSGNIFYNPFFIAQQEPDQIVWAICHEVLHYASGHGLRRGSRDPKKWNVAGDAWINDTLTSIPVGKPIPGTVNMPGSKDRTVEDIYATLPEDDGGKGKNKGGQGNPSGQGGDPMADDMEDDGAGKDPSAAAEADAQRKLDVAEAAQVAKAKGKLPGQLADFVSDTIESRTPWYDILERYMTERIKNDFSWARPNRRYMPDYYLPSIDGVGAMGPIVCQVDISGSISQQEIAHYNGHIKRIIEQCRPTKVHVIYTDTQVQKHEEFDNPDDVEIRFYSGGGTDMRAGFDYIEQHGIEPEVMVTLTDGYTPFPEDTSVPSVWCISTKNISSPCGENVHFSRND